MKHNKLRRTLALLLAGCMTAGLLSTGAAAAVTSEPAAQANAETHIATYVNTLPESIEWGEGVTVETFATPYNTVKAQAADGTEYTVEVVPENLVYFIDSKDFNENSESKSYNAVKALVDEGLLNDRYDQQSDGSVWGLMGGWQAKGTNDSNKDDKDYNGLYGTENKTGNTLIYAIPLSAGEYTLTSLHREWWNSRGMKATVQVGNNTIDAGQFSIASGEPDHRNVVSFTVPEDGMVTYTIAATGNNAPTISWLVVVRDGDVEEKPVDPDPVVSSEPDPVDPTVRPDLPEGYDRSLEDNAGLTLANGAAYTQITGFDNVLDVNVQWNNGGMYHASVNDAKALFQKTAFTVLLDVKQYPPSGDDYRVDQRVAMTIGNASNSLHLLTWSGKFGYGADVAGQGGISSNLVALTGATQTGWNCIAMAYEEKDGSNGSVVVYINGQKASEVANVGFKLSEMDDLTAMLARCFNTNYLQEGRYDNLVVFDQALDGHTLCQETAYRLNQKQNPPLDINALKQAIATAKAVLATGVENDTLQTALANAEAVLADANATQTQVDAVCNALRRATPGLGSVTIKGSDMDAAANNINGLTYKGFGMLNGNSTSNLLLDYRAENPDAYWAMMEYLFGGEHPIFTHIKMEMGNDGNNSTGAEACTMRYEDEEADASRSPGFVMAADAKEINPNVKVSILRWGSPNWVSDAGFYSGTEKGYEAMYKWYRETIFDAYEKYGYVVDFVNPDTNETENPNDAFIKWYANRVATETEFPEYFDEEAKAAYNNIRIIASDENKSLNIVPHMRKDADLYDAVDIIGFHYRTNATDDYVTMADKDDKEVWYSEGCATFSYSEYHENKNLEYGAGTIGGFQSPLALMDSFITAFNASRRTHYIFQPAIGSFYEGIQYGHKELLSARDPWSGYIHYDPALYMLEHFAKFAELGWEDSDPTRNEIWRAIPGATKSSYSGTSSEHATAGQDGNAGYLTLAAPDKSDFSVVFVNNTRSEKVFTITAEDMQVTADQKLAVWTTVTDSYLQNSGTVDCVDGTWTVRLPAYSVVTATTLTDVVPERAPVDGIHNEDRTVLDTDSTGRVSDTDDEYLYADDFDYDEYEQSYMADRGNEPRYMLDTHSAWIVENGMLKQELDRSVSQWNGGDPSTIVGDFRWMDYSVSVDIIYPEGAANGEWAGIGIRSATGMNWNNSGYTLHIQRDGWWNLYRVGSRVASGYVDASDSYRLTLIGLGDTVTAIIDGQVVATYQDANPMLSGRVKFSSGWNQVYFDNLEVKTVKGGIPYALSMIDGQDDSVSYQGSWDIGSSSPAGGSADDWYRSLSVSKETGTSFTFPFYGTGFALAGPNASSLKLDIYVDGELVAKDAACTATASRYETYVLSGLALGSHTAKVVVKAGTLKLDAIHALGERLEADQNAVVSVAPIALDSALTQKALLSALPETVTVTTAGGEEKALPVTWSIPSNKEFETNAFHSMAVIGTVEGVENAVGLPVLVSAGVDVLVPDGTVYYIDTVTGFSGDTPDTTEPYEAVKALLDSQLLNDKYDQFKTDENTWGLIDRDAEAKSYTGTGDAIATGIYGKNNTAGETLTYALTLPAGEYTLYSAHREWWSMNRPMSASLKIGGEAIDAGTINLSGSSGDQWNQVTFTVPEGGAVVEYTITATGTQAPVISLLAVAQKAEQPEPPAPSESLEPSESPEPLESPEPSEPPEPTAPTMLPVVPEIVIPGTPDEDIGNGDTPLADLPFVDVDHEKWYAQPIANVIAKGLMEGVSELLFAPEDAMTRGMMSQALYCLANKPETAGSSSFLDLADSVNYADAVAWGAETGVIKGYSDTEFGGEDALNRQQLAALLYRYAQQIEKLDTAADPAVLDEFPDRGRVSAWAEEAMAWAVSRELVIGRTDGTLDPRAVITRAEAAAILDRFSKQFLA